MAPKEQIVECENRLFSRLKRVKKLKLSKSDSSAIRAMTQTQIGELQKADSKNWKNRRKK